MMDQTVQRNMTQGAKQCSGHRRTPRKHFGLNQPLLLVVDCFLIPSSHDQETYSWCHEDNAICNEYSAKDCMRNAVKRIISADEHSYARFQVHRNLGDAKNDKTNPVIKIWLDCKHSAHM